MAPQGWPTDHRNLRAVKIARQDQTRRYMTHFIGGFPGRKPQPEASGLRKLSGLADHLAIFVTKIKWCSRVRNWHSDCSIHVRDRSLSQGGNFDELKETIQYHRRDHDGTRPIRVWSKLGARYCAKCQAHCAPTGVPRERQLPRCLRGRFTRRMLLRSPMRTNRRLLSGLRRGLYRALSGHIMR